MRRRRPARGPPPISRDADGEDAKHHEDEVEDAHGDPCAGYGRMAARLEEGHEVGAERRADHGAAAKAHDGKAGREPGTVREPLDERRDWRDVAEAEPDAADDAVAKIDEPEL